MTNGQAKVFATAIMAANSKSELDSLIRLVNVLLMTITYSTTEAKSRFSKVISHVREGKTIKITYRGEPVAEIRPIQNAAQPIEERLDELERRGVLERAKGPRTPMKVGKHIPGALQRFLDDRNRF